MGVDLAAIRSAAGKIGQHIHATPLVHSNSFSRMAGADVWIKAENLQKTGSFKVRGAFNRLMDCEGRQVIAASMGNHAQGVAYAARQLGMTARIVMPSTAPLVKQEATRSYGADLVLAGESFSEALASALAEKDFFFVHAFDDEKIIAGQGTVGLEICGSLDRIDAVLVPVGGGGLISGIAAAVRDLSPKTEVIGVQSSAAVSATLSLRENRIVESVPAGTIADGIAVGRVGELTFSMISRLVDDMITVDEDAIAMAVLLFLERKKLVVEGAGAVPLAALLSQADRFRGRRVVLVASGGNIDFTLVDRIIHKGLVSSGRIGVFSVTVNDVPGMLHRLSGIVSGLHGNIHTILHDRLGQDLSIGETRVVFTVETKGKDHLNEIVHAVAREGFSVKKLP
ncbi:MAG: threonine ammonia-lyase [Thermodesulfovibrionales bacterium]